MKDGHIPLKSSKRLGYWTSEEYRKFSLVAQVVLRGLVPDSEYHIWYLIARMTELVYNTGRDGWSKNDICYFERLAKRYNILVEDTLGVQCCVITGHNLEHLCEDVRRFSSPDNFWCCVFERAVKRYVQRSSNKKGIEMTFAKAEERRELTKYLQVYKPSECAGKNLAIPVEVSWHLCIHT